MARPALSLAIVLLPLAAFVLGTSMWGRAASPPVATPSSQRSDVPEEARRRFGWQWCPEPPGAEIRSSRVAPTEAGAKLVVNKGSLNIEWFWCRSKSSDALVLIHAQATNSGNEPLNLLHLDFSLYDQTGSFIGNHSVVMRKLDAHATTKIADKLPSQYSGGKWAPWSMKLASVAAN